MVVTYQRKTYQHPQSRSTVGKRADLDGQFFRSQAEANLARLFKHYRIPWEYEPREFTFPVKRGTRSYTPDFRIDLTPWQDPNKSKQAWLRVLEELEPTQYWIEVKGWMDPKSQTRLSRFIKYFPDEAEHFLLLVSNARNAAQKWNKRFSGQAKSIQIFDLGAIMDSGPILGIHNWEGRHARIN
jgi:hypothetical protein